MPNADYFAQLGLFVLKDFFDTESCAKLRSEMRSAAGFKATVYHEGSSQVCEQFRKTMRVEVSDTTVRSIHERLTSLVPALRKHFGTALYDCEKPQFLLYKEKDYFRPHQDLSPRANAPEYLKNRKVSLVIFLNGQARRPAADCYGGGALTFYKLLEKPTWETCRSRLDSESGLLIAFPSDIFHEVTPVTHGERYTIVSWLNTISLKPDPPIAKRSKVHR
jgi:SM-20-related protein